MVGGNPNAIECTGGENEDQSIRGCTDGVLKSSVSEKRKSEEDKTDCDTDEPGPGVENGRISEDCGLLLKAEEPDDDSFNGGWSGGNVKSGACTGETKCRCSKGGSGSSSRTGDS